MDGNLCGCKRYGTYNPECYPCTFRKKIIMKEAFCNGNHVQNHTKPFGEKSEQGDSVKWIQELLSQYGYLAAEYVTGYFGDKIE